MRDLTTARGAGLAAWVTAGLLFSACANGARTGGRDTGRSSDIDAASFDFPDAVLVTPDAAVLAGADAPGGDATATAALDARTATVDAHMATVDAPMPDASRTDAWVCRCTPGGACATRCGTTGARVCSPGCVEACAPPAELCNATDDDCDGACDEDLGACRADVVRAYHDTDGGHLYARGRAEALALGFRIEADPYFAVYPSAQPGTAPFHRCFLGRAHRLYTFDAGCEGSGAAYEGILGWVATRPVCGARALYRLSSRDDHFYTVDAAERDYAVSLGFVDEGVAAYVW